MFKRGHGRDLVLALLFLVGVFLMLKSSEDKVPGWLRGTRVESMLSRFGTGDQITFDLAIGIIVSIFFWVLVVRLPELDKRTRMRRNLQYQYKVFRQGCIRVFLESLREGYDPSLLDSLLEREQFRLFFKEPFCPGQDRWHAVANGLTEHNRASLITEFEIFIAEVRFTLTAIDVEDTAAFASLTNLVNVLYRARNYSPDYDGVKPLLRLMWSVCAGWNLIDGYSENDVISEMIEAV
jgi:hypothetical protein